jgi:predicted metal-dependent hydrolase
VRGGVISRTAFDQEPSSILRFSPVRRRLQTLQAKYFGGCYLDVSPPVAAAEESATLCLSPRKNPHPVRDPAGHSYHVEPIPVAAEASLSSDAFLWGLDLFNHGYYWEAHEAWEGLWQVADRDRPLRMLFKGLILLAAAGVKIREGKNAAAQRHATRAATLLRQLMKVPDRAFESALGMSPAALAEFAEAATRIPAELQATAPEQPQPVFNFILGANSRGSPSGSQKRNGHL